MTTFVDASAPALASESAATDGRRRLRPRIRTRESLQFLTEVGNVLAGSLDYQVTLQKVTELAVPRLACYCELALIENNQLQRLSRVNRHPTQQEARGRRCFFPADLDPADLLAGLLGSGEPLLLTPNPEDDHGAKMGDRDRRHLLRLAGATSLILVPLVARGAVLGALLLASTRTDRFYGPQDLLLAEELARTAALAIDNARLYSEANQAIRARDDVLRIVSHDLRNPIGVIATAATLVLKHSAMDPADVSARMLQTILRASRQATTLIDDLMELSRIESGRLTVDPRPEPLAPLVMEAVELHAPAARERGIQLSWTVAAPSPVVMVDHPRFLQLIGNLLSNAIRFTPPGGQIQIAAATNGDEARCCVTDTGPGIPPDQVPHVFDRFWQAARGDGGGLGLGLAIVQGIAAAHGGRVWVENEPGKGARFVFTLPLARD